MNPSFFYEDGDCDNTNHDIRITSGDLDGSDLDVVSAVLIQLNTDARFDSQRGWWGEEFMGFPIGSKLWSIQQTGITAIRADELVREAIEPLITQGLINDVRVNAIKTIDGVDVDIDLLRNNRSIFTVTL